VIWLEAIDAAAASESQHMATRQERIGALAMTEHRRRIIRLSSFVRITSVPMLFRSCADSAMAPGKSLDTDKCIEAIVVGWRVPSQNQR
jgi:hypothetical protein